MFSDTAPEKTLDTKNSLQNKYPEIENLIDNPSSDLNSGSISEQLEAIKESLKEVPEVNEARVLYFKSEIALSHYEIDSDNLALKMLNVE